MSLYLFIAVKPLTERMVRPLVNLADTTAAEREDNKIRIDMYKHLDAVRAELLTNKIYPSTRAIFETTQNLPSLELHALLTLLDTRFLTKALNAIDDELDLMADCFDITNILHIQFPSRLAYIE